MTLTDKIRAWREPAFRNTLSEAERLQLENPAGMIELSGTALDAVAGGGGKYSKGKKYKKYKKYKKSSKSSKSGRSSKSGKSSRSGRSGSC
jgi:mersacidin/lichenicidin family type 2 lantibiotic